MQLQSDSRSCPLGVSYVATSVVFGKNASKLPKFDYLKEYLFLMSCIMFSHTYIHKMYHKSYDVSSWPHPVK